MVEQVILHSAQRFVRVQTFSSVATGRPSQAYHVEASFSTYSTAGPTSEPGLPAGPSAVLLLALCAEPSGDRLARLSAVGVMLRR
jgi:hypothetical protein